MTPMVNGLSRDEMRELVPELESLPEPEVPVPTTLDRKSTRLNSSHQI